MIATCTPIRDRLYTDLDDNEKAIVDSETFWSERVMQLAAMLVAAERSLAWARAKVDALEGEGL